MSRRTVNLLTVLLSSALVELSANPPCCLGAVSALEQKTATDLHMLPPCSHALLSIRKKERPSYQPTSPPYKRQPFERETTARRQAHPMLVLYYVALSKWTRCFDASDQAILTDWTPSSRLTMQGTCTPEMACEMRAHSCRYLKTIHALLPRFEVN